MACCPQGRPGRRYASASGWTGFYLGAHLGYAFGISDFTATGAAGAAHFPAQLDLFNGYDAFKGTGSYFLGLEAGYNQMLPSRFWWRRNGRFIPEHHCRQPDGLVRGKRSGKLIPTLCGFSAPCAAASAMRPAIGCSMRPAVLPGPTINSPARSSPGRRRGATPIGHGSDDSPVARPAGPQVSASKCAIAPHWTAKLEYLFTDFGIAQRDVSRAARRLQLRSRDAASRGSA